MAAYTNILHQYVHIAIYFSKGDELLCMVPLLLLDLVKLWIGWVFELLQFGIFCRFLPLLCFDKLLQAFFSLKSQDIRVTHPLWKYNSFLSLHRLPLLIFIPKLSMLLSNASPTAIHSSIKRYKLLSELLHLFSQLSFSKSRKLKRSLKLIICIILSIHLIFKFLLQFCYCIS